MTRPGLTLLPSRLFRSQNATNSAARLAAATQCTSPQACSRNDCRCFAHVQDLDRVNRDIFFTGSVPKSNAGLGNGDHKPPDARTLQLGNTVRELHERLPTLLQSQLPSEILSPSISLHLFPSTHPHLPTVSGRIGYIAALWTAPVAWGRLPLVGNVKLTILSERMVRNGGSCLPHANRDEKLIVKWKTRGKTEHRDASGGVYRGVGLATRDPVDKIKKFISGATPGANAEEEEEEFCGLFIFEFDDEGRIAKHVIEHTEQGGHWDKTRVVSVTDWLLGTLGGKRREDVPALAWCEERPSGYGVRIVDRTRRFV